MLIEITQKVNPEIASDLLAGQVMVPGFILSYIRFGRKQVDMVTVVECADGDGSVGRGQREVRALESKDRSIAEGGL